MFLQQASYTPSFGGLGLRLRSVQPESLPVRPDGQVLRSIQVDLFGTDGKPMRDVRLLRSAGLRVALTNDEVREMGGLANVIKEHGAGRLRLQKLASTGRSWTDLRTAFDIATQTFSASVSQFSTFALTWSGRQSDAAVSPTATATATVTATPMSTTPPSPTPRPTPIALPTITPTPAAPSTGEAPISTPLLIALALMGAVSVAGGLLLYARRNP